MKKQRYSDVVSEYWAQVNDLSISVFVAGNTEAPRSVNEVLRFLHTHSYIEIFVCVSGDLSIATEQGMIKLFAGDIAFLPTGRSHSAMTDGSNFFTLGMLGTKSDAKGSCGTYGELSHLFLLDGARIYRRADKAVALLREIVEHEYSHDSFIPAVKTVAALVELLGKSYEVSGTVLPKKKIADSRDIMRFLIIEDIVNCSYTESVKPEEVASRLFITRRHLDRLMREKYGKTLVELVNENRIKHAKRLLVDSDLSLEKIASRVGFASVSSLKNNFIKIVGISAGEYRRKRNSDL